MHCPFRSPNLTSLSTNALDSLPQTGEESTRTNSFAWRTTRSLVKPYVAAGNESEEIWRRRNSGPEGAYCVRVAQSAVARTHPCSSQTLPPWCDRSASTPRSASLPEKDRTIEARSLPELGAGLAHLGAASDR